MIEKVYSEYIDDALIYDLYVQIVLIIANLLIQRGDINNAQKLYYQSLDYIESLFEIGKTSVFILPSGEEVILCDIDYEGYIEIIKSLCFLLLKNQNKEKEAFDLIESKICKFTNIKDWFIKYKLIENLYRILSNLYLEKRNIELAEIYTQRASELKDKLREEIEIRGIKIANLDL